MAQLKKVKPLFDAKDRWIGLEIVELMTKEEFEERYPDIPFTFQAGDSST